MISVYGTGGIRYMEVQERRGRDGLRQDVELDGMCHGRKGQVCQARL